MLSKGKKSDYEAMPRDYRDFYDAVAAFIPESRLLIDPLKTLAFGTDASFYRLIPKIVIKAGSVDETTRILQTATGSGSRSRSGRQARASRARQ